MRYLPMLCLAASHCALPALAEDNDHAHVAEAEGLRIVHAWTRATSGLEAYVFAEIENTGTVPRLLTGAETETASADQLVGFSLKDGSATWTVLPGIPVDPGAELHLEPEVLATRLEGLTTPLTEGGDLDLHFVFDGLEIEAEAEIGAANATAHSHAGHNHP